MERNASGDSGFRRNDDGRKGKSFSATQLEYRRLLPGCVPRLARWRRYIRHQWHL